MHEAAKEESKQKAQENAPHSEQANTTGMIVPSKEPIDS